MPGPAVEHVRDAGDAAQRRRCRRRPMMFSTVGSMLSPSPAAPSSAAPSESAATATVRGRDRRRRRGRRPAPPTNVSPRPRDAAERRRWPSPPMQRSKVATGVGRAAGDRPTGRRAGAEVGGVDAGATVDDGHDRHADAAGEAVVAAPLSTCTIDAASVIAEPPRTGHDEVAGERLRRRGRRASDLQDGTGDRSMSGAGRRPRARSRVQLGRRRASMLFASPSARLPTSIGS